MNYNILKLLILFLLIIGVTSCSDDDDNQEHKTYKLSSIMWKLDEGDGEEIVKEVLPEKVYENNASIEDIIIVDLLAGIKETSHFQTQDSEQQKFLKLWGTDTSLVPIPKETSVLSSEYGYLLSSVQAPLLSDVVVIPPTSKLEKKYFLSPKTKMTCQDTVFLKKVTATFSASFRAEKDHFDEFKVEGKWSGLIIHHTNGKTIYEEIK